MGAQIHYGVIVSAESLLWVAAGSALLAAALCAVVLIRVSGVRAFSAEDGQRLRLLAEQALAAGRAESETTRAHLAAVERALGGRAEQARLELQGSQGQLTTMLVREQGEARALLETKLREMAEQTAARLGDIQRSVNEQLHQAVERQMQTSFQRVIDQFAQVQKAMGDVQAVTSQIGDLRRIFSNVKARGGWGELQLRSLLDDLLPQGAYEVNRNVRADSDEVVEFAILMPMKGEQRPVLAVDAKFPVEDYERLLLASEQGDLEGERTARRGLETRLRQEARKIGAKYINPPITVEFAVLYLPTDGLYVEAARIPGLLEEISRTQRVLIVGPSLCPALLRTIQLGFVTLALEQKADHVHQLLGATRTEMLKMDGILERLGKQASNFSNTIDDARKRTRVVDRKLRSVGVLDAAQADTLLADDEAGAL